MGTKFKQEEGVGFEVFLDAEAHTAVPMAEKGAGHSSIVAECEAVHAGREHR